MPANCAVRALETGAQSKHWEAIEKCAARTPAESKQSKSNFGGELVNYWS